MANPALNQAILQSLFRMNPNLRDAPMLNQQIIDSAKSAQWNAKQIDMLNSATTAGIPTFQATQTEAPARLMLQDAIKRSEILGFSVPHFIGTANEPTGDRGVTMDIENLVKALKSQEQVAMKAGDKAGVERISKERAFWEKEAAEGMSAEQWKTQTGENDPIY